MPRSEGVVLPVPPPSCVISEESVRPSESKLPHLHAERAGQWPPASPASPGRSHQRPSEHSSLKPFAASRKHGVLHQTFLANRIFCSPPNGLICLPCALADGLVRRPHWFLRLQASETKKPRCDGEDGERKQRTREQSRGAEGQCGFPYISPCANLGCFPDSLAWGLDHSCSPSNTAKSGYPHPQCISLAKIFQKQQV